MRRTLVMVTCRFTQYRQLLHQRLSPQPIFNQVSQHIANVIQTRLKVTFIRSTNPYIGSDNLPSGAEGRVCAKKISNLAQRFFERAGFVYFGYGYIRDVTQTTSGRLFL
jgi:hypothetical protein